MSTKCLERETSRQTRCTQARWPGSDHMSLRDHLSTSRTPSWRRSRRTGTCTTQGAGGLVCTSSWTALSHYVEITALPRTHIISELAKYTSDPDEKSKLELMASTTAEGKANYQTWVVDGCRHLGHILSDLPSCKPPVDHVLELLPRLQPRFYSIASSGKVSPTSIAICGVVVEYKIPDGRSNYGVATTWLREKLPVGEGEERICPKVPAYV